MGQTMKQGGIADKLFIRPWQKRLFCQGHFLFPLAES
jgi:hypothetical protein